LYQINRKGEVKSLERYVDKYGYKKVTLNKLGKKYYFTVHILLYKTFIGDYESEFFKIDHIDRNTLNNCLGNFRLVSNRCNMNNRTDQSNFGIGVTKTKIFTS